MDTKHLHLFLEVARRGSFAEVARDHDLDPSSVSRAMKGLENELGVRLFQRTTRSLSLTEAGQVFFEQIVSPMENLAEARDACRSVSSTPRGHLRLTASVAFGQTCIVPILPQFREVFPALNLELLLTDANLDLVSDRIDLAIRLGRQPQGDWMVRRLYSTRYHVCASPCYEGGFKLETPADLSHHPCLLFALPRYRTLWKFRSLKTGIVEDVPVHGNLTISNALSLADSARAGLGPSLLADWLVGEDLVKGTLVDLFPGYEVCATDFDTAAWLVYPSKTYMPLKLRRVIDFLIETLGD